MPISDFLNELLYINLSQAMRLLQLLGFQLLFTNEKVAGRLFQRSMRGRSFMIVFY